jgi:serine/threonine-protein kinase
VNADDAAYCISCGFPLTGITADPTSDPRTSSPESAASLGYLATGALVDGKYEVEKILGEGGMGVVYLARDVHTETPVVVKSIRAQFADNPEFRARTLAEGRALARIDHPNVVRLNAVVVEKRTLYLVMQFIEGEPLDQMIARHIEARTPLPVSLALSIFRMILQGVGAAHAEGLIHRDLKPANILIRKKDGVAKVTDFGIAKGEEDAKAGRGVTKGIIGSLSYMAPEQIRGQRDLDKRVDIYALGILLFELLIGRVPFEAPSDYEIMRMHTEVPIPSISAMRPDVSPYIDEAVRRACAKDRASRFASTEEFLAALDGPRRPATVPLAVPPVDQMVPIGGTARASAPTEMAAAPPFASFVPAVLPRGDTGEGASLPPGPKVERRRRGTLLWAAAVSVVAAAAGGTALYLGSNGNPSKPPPPDNANVDAGGSPLLTNEQHEAAAPSPLAALAGNWRSTSKRDFTAVLASDDTLEFRVQQAVQHPRQGYEDGEVRFKLIAVQGTSEFAVEDHIRPTPPPGLEYEPSSSRESCVGTWTSVKGKKLLAQFDGASTLTVDLVQIRTGPEKFKIKGKRVIGCTDLASSPADPIESKLSLLR